MVYVDEILDYKTGKWCHMSADTLDEMHEMAMRIGLPKNSFQPKRVLPHYDLRPSKRDLAIKCGAIELSCFAFIEWKWKMWPRERIFKELGIIK